MVAVTELLKGGELEYPKVKESALMMGAMLVAGLAPWLEHL